MNPTILYRAEVSFWADTLHVMMCECPVVRTTPKGCFVKHAWRERFILNKARKKFAHTTPELALLALKARRRRQIKILEAQLRDAKAVLYVLDSGRLEGSRGLRHSFIVE